LDVCARRQSDADRKQLRQGGLNGDIGYIDDVGFEDSELTASFDGRTVIYGFGELDTLVPAYAATIHKSQGSEYLRLTIEDGIADVRLNRADKMNALDPAIFRAIAEAGALRREDRSLRAVVLSGEGRAASHTERDISTALIVNGFL
jgi:hypothetical protein